MYNLLSDDCSPFEGSLQFFLPVAALLLEFVSQVIHVVKHRVLAHHFEADVNVQQNSLLLHDESRVKPRPDLDLVLVQVVSLSRIEGLSPYAFELKPTHERVEEDLQEVQVISVGGFHQLDPINLNGILHAIVLCLQLGHLLLLPQTVDAAAPFNEELKTLLDLVLHCPYDLSAQLSGIVRNLRLKFDCVFVDALDGWLVKFQLEVVGEELQFLS